MVTPQFIGWDTEAREAEPIPKFKEIIRIPDDC